MRQRDRQQARLLADRAPGSGNGCPPRQPVPPGADRGRQHLGLGGLWLLLVPVACCGGPLLVAGLAAAGALAWGGLGLALAALLVGALTVRLHRRARAGAATAVSPSRPSWLSGRFRRDDHAATRRSRAAGRPAQPGLPGQRADPADRVVPATAAGSGKLRSSDPESAGGVRCTSSM